MMVSLYQNLRSFQHCKKDIDLVCFNLPVRCPLCGQSTSITESRIPPYVLPSPITSSQTSPRSIVLKPTDGDFLRNYDKACNLHIGITNNQGQVFDFDENGLKVSSEWHSCLTVSDLGRPDEWDSALQYICSLSLWTPCRYNEISWNCFDFALNFLNLLKSLKISRGSSMTRKEFCNDFLVEKTKSAEQYIHLYRQATTDGFVIVPKSIEAKDFKVL